ncbi:MAG: tetratricopeptide repeat protein [Planctomycetaceae bacterium]
MSLKPSIIALWVFVFGLLAPLSLHAQDAPVADQPAATDEPKTAADAAKPDDASAKSDATKEAGQADLDEAMVQRIDAETPEELEVISALIESALAKGLSDESKSFAKKMLASIQFERAQAIAAQLMQGGGRRIRQMRTQALESLQAAIKNDPGLVEAYMMIGRLNLLPEGDAEEVRKAATKAIELLADNPAEQSDAYVLRALRQTADEDKMSDLNAAVKADPTSTDALQARALLRLQMSDVNGAIEDLQALLKQDPSNQAIAQAAVEQLVKMNRISDALKLLNEALEASPNEGLYRLRGIIYRTEGKEEEALADFDKALAMQPKDPISLLQRAEISLARGDVKSAKRDLREAIRVAPQVADSVAAVRVRCYIAAEEGRMADAINDMKLLVANAPDDVFWQLQLANLYLQDKRPREAIEIATGVIERDAKNVSALRLRADTLLGIGDHAAAIKDYEKALEHGIDDKIQRSGVLNNLAWVLATSPKDDVRDADRALKFGQEAAELTEHKEAHILSTLAAAYAEKGQFEGAIKWSTKAVELGKAEEHAQIEQLELELESYRKGEPWREKQETEENKVPLLAPEDLIDT